MPNPSFKRHTVGARLIRTLGRMFRSRRSSLTPAALAVLGVALAGYSFLTADLTVPKLSELVQIDGVPTEVARSRFKLTVRVEGPSGSRVLHYSHSSGDSASIRNLLAAQGDRAMRFGYLPASAGKPDLWGASYDTLYQLEANGQRIQTPAAIHSHRLNVLAIELAVSVALLLFAWRQATRAT